VCETCGAVQAPRGDEFARLGVERRFELDAGELEARYRELSRKLHPDRFAKADARERMLSLQASTALNEAYRTLKQPVKRAERLLELAGAGLGDDDAVDQEFLIEILALREALLDAKLEGNQQAVQAMMADMRARRDAAMSEIARLFAVNDLDGIKQRLIALRYFQRFLDEETRGQED
jgi:molecular chaperone HscB